jgi:hypothetical protein
MSKSDAVAKPSWQTLILLCRDCSKRSKGPKGFSSKEAMAEVRLAVRAERPRPRVVRCSCMGLCPKQAIAVARVGVLGVMGGMGAAGGAQWAAAETLLEVRQFVSDAARQGCAAARPADGAAR